MQKQNHLPPLSSPSSPTHTPSSFLHFLFFLITRHALVPDTLCPARPPVLEALSPYHRLPSWRLGFTASQDRLTGSRPAAPCWSRVACRGRNAGSQSAGVGWGEGEVEGDAAPLLMLQTMFNMRVAVISHSCLRTDSCLISPLPQPQPLRLCVCVGEKDGFEDAGMGKR